VILLAITSVAISVLARADEVWCAVRFTDTISIELHQRFGFREVQEGVQLPGYGERRSAQLCWANTPR